MKIGVRNLLLFPSYAHETNSLKIFDGPTLNADAFVWLRELVSSLRTVPEKCSSSKSSHLTSSAVFVWRSLQHLKKGWRPRVVLDGVRHICIH